jgi:hypothetical protein
MNPQDLYKNDISEREREDFGLTKNRDLNSILDRHIQKNYLKLVLFFISNSLQW